MKIFAATAVAAVLIGIAFVVAGGGGNGSAVPAGNGGNNVSVIDGKQIINLTAKGGYTPFKSVAKAGLPTILRFATSGTFDCSSFVRIPSMNIGKSLSQSGTTDIDLGNPQTGILRGVCAMGMYPFEIDFQN